MKEVYIAPVASVITLAAVEKLAALDGHPAERAGNTIIGGVSNSVGPRPGGV